MAQNNRIPSVLRDFAGAQRDRPALSHLCFEDWLAKAESDSKDWIPVARSWRTPTDDQFTFSVLASAKEGVLEKLLAKHSWEVMVDFDAPAFTPVPGKERKFDFDPGTAKVVDGIELSSFTIHRFFHGYVPATFELLQGFVLYHEAFFVPDLSQYQRIDADGNIQVVARLLRERDNHAILVDAHHIRDYLAARKCYLVRYHDHRRWAPEDISPLLDAEFRTYPVQGDRSKFELWLRTDIPREGLASSSRLLGKDIVLPFPSAEHSHLWALSAARHSQHSTFIIGRDDEGQDIEATCSEDELSNYFVDRGTPHFLTPVYFRQEVLAKYYQEPKRYSVGASQVGCLSLWSIPIDITDEDLVQVWLGDLGRIPYSEQLHWRQFNVAPRGTITRHRWLRDFMAEFADAENDPVYAFHVAFDDAQSTFRERHAGDLFLRLTDKDSHLYDTLHIPLTEEWAEFDAQVQSIAKITVDSLNVALLSAITGKSVDGTLIKGSLDLLAEYLRTIQAPEATIRAIVGPLQAVQAIRSTGAAHRKGANFEETLCRLQLENMGNRARIATLLANASTALSSLAIAVVRA